MSAPKARMSAARPKEKRLARIEPQREIGERGVERMFAQGVRIADRRKRVQIGDEVECLAAILQLDELVNGSVVVAHMEPPR